ncbi:MAG: bifunctional folylpolyglutamate synthase/dihydrofolate synthase [Gemmatimonas sp.]|nr:bifunctional folylpolyglutamate synthase/dihydrofolate synthase [Gemmatimonas sp.]
MTLEDLTPWLFSRTTGGIRWGLERTEELLAGVGDPHRRFSSVLIGGTNGKGSVAALCDAALRAGANARSIGLYTSPHLVSFTERVRIDGRPAAEEALASAAKRLKPAIERTGASFFEATTAMAFLAFAEAGVDLAVVEVGLGGRLDATNVLIPLATAITNISRDHEEYLGAELEGIAREKGGIFKPHVPALSAVPEPDLRRVLERCAEEVGAPLVHLDELASVEDVETEVNGTRFRLRSGHWRTGDLQLRLAGAHQARNAAVAAELLALLPPAWRPRWDTLVEGFASAQWPGRLQLEEVGDTRYLLDVAHNPAGVLTLTDALDRLAPPRPWLLLLSILADKPWREMVTALVHRADKTILTQAPSAPEHRRWDLAEVSAWIRRALGTNALVIPTLEAAVDQAASLGSRGTVIVTGSFHTVGDAMRILGISAL